MKKTSNQQALEALKKRITERLTDIQDRKKIFGVNINPENGHWQDVKKYQPDPICQLVIAEKIPPEPRRNHYLLLLTNQKKVPAFCELYYWNNDDTPILKNIPLEKIDGLETILDTISVKTVNTITQQQRRRIKQTLIAYQKNIPKNLFNIETLPETIAPQELIIIYETALTLIETQATKQQILEMKPGGFPFIFHPKSYKDKIIRHFAIANNKDCKYNLIFEPKGKTAQYSLRLRIDSPTPEQQQPIVAGKEIAVIKAKDLVHYRLGYSFEEKYKEIDISDPTIISALKDIPEGEIQDSKIRQKLFQLCTSDTFLTSSAEITTNAKRNKKNQKRGSETCNRPAFIIDSTLPVAMVATTIKLEVSNKSTDEKYADILRAEAIASETGGLEHLVSEQYQSSQYTKCVLYSPAASHIDAFEFKKELTRNGGRGTTAGDLLCILHQLVARFKQVHDSGHIHGDVKLDNILLFAVHLLVVNDFYSAKKIHAPDKESHYGNPGSWSTERWLKYWYNFTTGYEESKNFNIFLREYVRLPNVDEIFAIKIIRQLLKKYGVHELTPLLSYLQRDYHFFLPKERSSILDDTFAVGIMLNEYSKTIEKLKIKDKTLQQVLQGLLGDPTDEERYLHGHNLLSLAPTRMTLTEAFDWFDYLLHSNNVLSTLTFSDELDETKEKEIKGKDSKEKNDTPPGKSREYLQTQIKSHTVDSLIATLDKMDHYLSKTVDNPLTDECYRDWQLYLNFLYNLLIKQPNEKALVESIATLHRSFEYFKDKNVEYAQLLKRLKLQHSLFIPRADDEVKLLQEDLKLRLNCYRTRLQLTQRLEANLHKYAGSTVPVIPSNLPKTVVALQRYRKTYRNYYQHRVLNFPKLPLQILPVHDTTSSDELLLTTLDSMNQSKLVGRQLSTPQLKNLVRAISHSSTNMKPVLKYKLQTDLLEQKPEEKKSLVHPPEPQEPSEEKPIVKSIGKIEETLQAHASRSFKIDFLRQNNHWSQICHFIKKWHNINQQMLEIKHEAHETKHSAFQNSNETINSSERTINVSLIIELEKARNAILSLFTTATNDFSNLFSSNPYVQALSSLKPLIETTQKTDSKWTNDIISEISKNASSKTHFVTCERYFSHRRQYEENNKAAPPYSANFIKKHNDYITILNFILLQISTHNHNHEFELKSAAQLQEAKLAITQRISESINHFDSRYQFCLQLILQNLNSDTNMMPLDADLLHYLIEQVNTHGNFFLQSFYDVDDYLRKRHAETRGNNTRNFNLHDFILRQHAYLNILKAIQERIRMNHNKDDLAEFIRGEARQFNGWKNLRHEFADKLNALADAFVSQRILLNDPQLTTYLDNHINYYTVNSPLHGLKIFDGIENHIRTLRSPVILVTSWRTILKQINVENKETCIAELNHIITKRGLVLSTEQDAKSENALTQDLLDYLIQLKQALENNFIPYDENLRKFLRTQEECYTCLNNIVTESQRLISIKDSNIETLSPLIAEYRYKYAQHLEFRQIFDDCTQCPTAEEILAGSLFSHRGLLYHAVRKLEGISEQTKNSWVNQACKLLKIAPSKEINEKKIEYHHEEKSTPAQSSVPSSLFVSPLPFTTTDAKTVLPITTPPELIKEIEETIRQQLKFLDAQMTTPTCCCFFIRPNAKLTADKKVLQKLIYELSLPASADYPDLIEDSLLSAVKKLASPQISIALKQYLPHFLKTQSDLLLDRSHQLQKLQTNKTTADNLQSKSKIDRCIKEIDQAFINLKAPDAKPLSKEDLISILIKDPQPFIPNSKIINQAALKSFIESAEEKISNSEIIEI